MMPPQTPRPAPADADRAQAIAPENQIVRLRGVLSRTGLGRSTIYRMVAAHRFPAPVRLGGRAVGWRLADLDRWTQSLSPTRH